MSAAHAAEAALQQLMPSRAALPAVLLAPIVLFPAGYAAAQSAPVRIAGSAWVADAPTKVAAELGLFADAASDSSIDAASDSSIPVRVDNHDSGRQALDSLLAGDAEFALAAATPVARALLDWQTGSESDARPPLTVLAGVSQSNRTHVLIADNAAGIDSAADLAGSRVAVMMGTSAHFTWSRFMSFHGLDAGSTTLVDVPVSAQREAVETGRVDAAMTWEPWASRLSAALGERARVFSTRHLHTVTWLLLTRPDVLSARPGLPERVLTAYASAIDFILENPERARAMQQPQAADDADMRTPEDAGVIWSLALNSAVLADLELQFRWLTEQRGLAVEAAPAPYEYLSAEPLLEVAPRRATLPAYFFADGGTDARLEETP